ncbi:hypothetical protein CALVIDRAFT_526180 [Calocera viscosa TUFC12733]|uniref:Ketoreductase (KR) domain-containing protein n=1 Tax=Calocera viscosa (strain TUFC12733) TaxID=1330018 RepID=A0A167P184_CALVF|nr:hypothetical protein CALVIDRAFT_526180 [Calocera viscosa TUFC12733]
MPVPLLLTISSRLPSTAYLPLLLCITLLALLYTYARGTSNPRLRDMHARTVLLTTCVPFGAQGGLTPLGLSILDSLASLGAHVILLEPTTSSPSAQLLLPALQEQHKNPSLHVAECDLASPASVREFVGKFARTTPGAGGEQARVDAVVLCGGYGWRGAGGAEGTAYTERTGGAAGKTEEGAEGAEELGAFLLTTMLLPLLLRAPGTRDIRLVNVVNPFYAAAFPGFPELVLPPADAGDEKDGLGGARGEPGKTGKEKENGKKKISSFQREGIRSLRSIIWSVYLQRVLDALVPVPTEPGPEPELEVLGGKDKVLDEKARRRRSNILSLAVCPGFSRADVAAPYLGASGPSATLFGVLRYLLLWPMLFITLKPPAAAAQSVLYALYAPASSLASVPSVSPPTSLPTSPATDAAAPSASTAKLYGGTLYRECLPILPPRAVSDWGGESVGRAVWEGLEERLKALEQLEKEEVGRREAQGGRLETVREEQEPAEPHVDS